MFRYLFNYLFVLCLITIAFSCSNKNNEPEIKFSQDRSSIIIKNIDEVSLLKVKNAYQANPDSLNLVTVLISPGELDSLQDEIEVPGKIFVRGDSLIFKPSLPFLKTTRYLVESYIGVKYANAAKLLTGNAKQNLQPQRQILTR